MAWALDRWAMLAAVSWLASGALYLALPPSPDQFNHAYMGWRLAEGDVPYRDFVDMNWPGVMSLHALAVWLFGVNLWSWRALDYVLFGASALLLADLLRLACGRGAARLGLILLPPIYAGAALSGQHDMSAAQFLLAALWFHVRGYRSGSWWWQLGSGLFIAAAMLNKPTVGAIGLLLPLHALWMRQLPASVLAHTLAAGLAAVASLALAFSLVIARGASPGEIVDAVYAYNLATQYVDGRPLASVIERAVRVHATWWTVLVVASVPALFWMFRRGNASLAATALPVLWAAGIVSYLVQAQGFAYHLAPCLLALAGMATLSIALVADGRIAIPGERWRRPLAVGFVLVALVGIGYKVASFYSWLPGHALAGDDAGRFSRFKVGDHLSVADALAFARRLDAPPHSDCVLVVGSGSAVNYLARRRQPTRFYYFPVLERTPASAPFAQRWLALWERDLGSAKCRYTLVPHGDVSSGFRGQPGVVAALREFLLGYRVAGTLGAEGAMVVYERN